MTEADSRAGRCSSPRRRRRSPLETMSANNLLALPLKATDSVSVVATGPQRLLLADYRPIAAISRRRNHRLRRIGKRDDASSSCGGGCAGAAGSAGEGFGSRRSGSPPRQSRYFDRPDEVRVKLDCCQRMLAKDPLQTGTAPNSPSPSPGYPPRSVLFSLFLDKLSPLTLPSTVSRLLPMVSALFDSICPPPRIRLLLHRFAAHRAARSRL